MSTPLRRFIPAALAAPPPPGVYEFGVNFRATAGTPAPDARDVIVTSNIGLTTLTNANNVSVDCRFPDLGFGMFTDSATSGTDDNRLAGWGQRTAGSGTPVYFEMRIPAGTYRARGGFGAASAAVQTSVRFEIWDAIYGGGGTRLYNASQATYTSTEYVAVGQDALIKYADAAAWVAAYDATAREIVIPDRGASTGVLFAVVYADGGTQPFCNHIRVEEVT